MELVNKLQSKEQRRNKYLFLRECGVNHKVAVKLRDWTHRHIIEYLHANKETVRTMYNKENDKTSKEPIKLTGVSDS